MKAEWICSEERKRWSRRNPKAGRSGADLFVRVTGERFQAIRGIGGCFNELGAIALGWLSPKDRKRVLDELFQPGEGCNFNYCRMPIGASDFGASWYSLNETDGDFAMKHFTVERDRRILMPFIKEAVRRRPDLYLFASPWSPPTWLKFPKVFNYGKVVWEPKYLKALALYFLKVVRAYAAEGITINAIHPQNEPVADQKFPSCLWTGAEMRDFIRDYLGPLFEREKVPAEVWLGTLNVDNYEDYPLTVLSDPVARKYVKGIAYQWWGKAIIQKTRAAWPGVPLIQSENECGDGRNTWDYAHYIFNLMHHYFTNGVEAYTYWNMVLPAGGRSTWGWTQNSMVCVDQARKKAVFNPEHYLMKHFSRFAPRGSARLGTAGPWSGNAVAFGAPGGATAVVLQNPLHEAKAVTVEAGGTAHELVLPARSFSTLHLGR
jgi:glucosylceramidase